MKIHNTFTSVFHSQYFSQTYKKTLDFYASPIKNKTTSLSFALFVLLVHNFLLSLGLQLLTYKLAYYETSMWS